MFPDSLAEGTVSFVVVGVTEVFGKTGFLFVFGEKKVENIKIIRTSSNKAKTPRRAYNLTSFFLIPITFFCSFSKSPSFISIRPYCLNESDFAEINSKSIFF